MKKMKLKMLLIGFLISINGLQAQCPTSTTSTPVEDVYNLACPFYQDLVTADGDYSRAIRWAIANAKANGGGIILLPGNTEVNIVETISLQTAANDTKNIQFSSTHSKATLKYTGTTVINQMLRISGNENIGVSNIIFDGNGLTGGITALSSNNITITNCEFQNFKGQRDSLGFTTDTSIGVNIGSEGSGIVTNVAIKDCKFRTGSYGIRALGRNSQLRIENNKFEPTLARNPILIQGNTDSSINNKAFSDHVWILNNDIEIGRARSVIDQLNELERGEDGVVTGLGSVNGSPGDPSATPPIPPSTNYNADYYAWRWGGGIAPSAIYITSGNRAGNHDLSAYANYHQNIVIDGNIAIGPDYGFFDGGTADLYSLKDIIRLKCTNNVARNAGDLGFAIERSRNAIISNNTADRNNSFGMAIATTRNSIISNNIFDNNALRRNFIYNSSPYGGLLISGYSFNNIIEGNNFYSYSSANVSLAILDEYTERASPTQFYGIILRTESYIDPGSGDDEDDDTTVVVKPSLNKIGVNHYSGNRWGSIYNEEPISTQIVENFSATDFPKNRDYPVGTWFRNSDLNGTALGWSVVNRIETTTTSNWQPNSNANVSTPFFIENNDGGTAQIDDVIGIMLDDGNIHWSTIKTVNVLNDTYTITLHTNPTLSVSDAIVDPSAKVAWGMGRVIILRWLTVTK